MAWTHPNPNLRGELDRPPPHSPSVPLVFQIHLSVYEEILWGSCRTSPGQGSPTPGPQTSGGPWPVRNQAAQQEVSGG